MLLDNRIKLKNAFRTSTFGQGAGVTLFHTLVPCHGIRIKLRFWSKDRDISQNMGLDKDKICFYGLRKSVVTPFSCYHTKKRRLEQTQLCLLLV